MRPIAVWLRKWFLALWPLLCIVSLVAVHPVVQFCPYPHYRIDLFIFGAQLQTSAAIAIGFPMALFLVVVAVRTVLRGSK